MNNYFILMIGWVIGQAAWACIRSWDIQRKIDNISFTDALKIVYGKETAASVFGVVMLAAALFLMPDLYRQTLDADNNLKPLSGWQQNIITYMRISSILFGAVCQLIGYYFFGRAAKYIRDKADKEGIELPNQ